MKLSDFFLVAALAALALPSHASTTTLTFEGIPNLDLAQSSPDVSGWGTFSLGTYGDHAGTVIHGFGDSTITFGAPVVLQSMDLWGDFEGAVAMDMYRNGVLVYELASSDVPQPMAGGDGLASLTLAFRQPIDQLVFRPQSDGVVVDNLAFESSVSAVPEPAGSATLLAGLGLVGVMSRRRRR